MFRIYLPLSLDLPTVGFRFTYRRNWIYLLLLPDLPTIVTGFTYRYLQIYLPLSQDLPTIISDLPTIVGPLYWKSFQKSQNLTVSQFISSADV